MWCFSVDVLFCSTGVCGVLVLMYCSAVPVCVVFQCLSIVVECSTGVYGVLAFVKSKNSLFLQMKMSLWNVLPVYMVLQCLSSIVECLLTFCHSRWRHSRAC